MANDLKYPIRADSHVQERVSKELLLASIPEHWIPREITERDYGIDALVEIVEENRELRGEIVFIQLKSSAAALIWNEKDIATESGISTKTAAYWLGFAIPVFLCIADIETSQMYFANAKDQARRQYKELVDQESCSFRFRKQDRLTRESAMQAFYSEFKREWQHQTTLARVYDLLMHFDYYWDVVTDQIGRDFHLPMEQTEEFFHVWRLVDSGLDYLGGAPLPIPLDLYLDDNNIYDKYYGGNYGELYSFFSENIATWLVAALAFLAPSLISRLSEEEDYWRAVDPIFHGMADRIDSSKLAERIKSIIPATSLSELFNKGVPPLELFQQTCESYATAEIERVASKMLKWAEQQANGS
ncbi:MAG TPA: DUF4365 domain-containing protein [Fimbriimonadaceae bacterium]|jgi:hypothetical protein